MTIIQVPKPPPGAMNPDRPVSALLKAQMAHLHEAQKRLPFRLQSELYINAIRTEAEASRYVAEVTAAILVAHKRKKLPTAKGAQMRKAVIPKKQKRKNPRGKSTR